MNNLNIKTLLSDLSALRLLADNDLGWEYHGSVYIPGPLPAVSYGIHYGQRVWRHIPTGFEFNEQYVKEELTSAEAREMLIAARDW